MSDPSIICPRCQRESFHPKDIEHGYCGFCHDFTFGIVHGKQSAGVMVNGIVSHRDKMPYIQLANDRGLVGQLSVAQARKIAMDILTMAYRTEMDAMLLKFMEEKVGAPHQIVGEAMMLFREFRHNSDMEVVEGREIDPEATL